MKRAFTLISLCLCLLMAAEGLVPVAQAQTSRSEIVVAQDNRGLGGFFRRLFRPRNEWNQPRDLRAPRQGRQQLRRVEPERPARRQRRARSAAPAPREIASVEKAEDAKRVLVVGDFLASALAKGLAVAYRENPDALVIDATSGSSGLVRNDYYDWPGKLPAIIEEQKPDAILVLVGGNDRQNIATDGSPYSLGTDEWRAAYAARVNAVADAVKASGKPGLWVGLMPVESSTMSRDYSAFNGIVREQLETKDLPFIEVWNGFADAEGKYVVVGPDVRGQSVQLRAGDGLNFTRAGQRKLAYFVEQELEAIFGGTAPQLAAADDATVVEPGEEGPQIGPMVPIDALATAGGDALTTLAPQEEGGSATEAIAKRLAGEEAPPLGRADFYTWPPPKPAPATEEEPAASEEPSTAEAAESEPSPAATAEPPAL